jgi:hypothetical protein
MNHKDKTLLGSAIGAILCVAATSASAVTLSASNVCGTPPCGASFLSGQWNQSPSAVVEEQYFMVDVGASDLLTYTGEHLAMSAFAQSQPSLTRGGIALQNPTGERDIWYGFLNVSSSTLDVEYTVVSESYSSAP